MKKLIVSFLLMFLPLPVFSQGGLENNTPVENSKPFEVGITFDWISKTQLQRDESIKEIQKILFNNDISKYTRKSFKSTYADFLKEKDYLTLYDEISKGKKEDANRYYCGFYVGKLLIAYGVQYKNNMKNIYYYDAMGTLRWVDIFSDNYPDFPYWSYQYYRNGKIAAAYYYVSDYDQYVFDANKEFKGRWYKENMYNRNAKIIMTRSNY